MRAIGVKDAEQKDIAPNLINDKMWNQKGYKKQKDTSSSSSTSGG